MKTNYQSIVQQIYQQRDKAVQDRGLIAWANGTSKKIGRTIHHQIHTTQQAS